MLHTDVLNFRDDYYYSCPLCVCGEREREEGEVQEQCNVIGKMKGFKLTRGTPILLAATVS